MEHKPNEIKEYYIAYFDILGYKDFFAETPDKAEDFLNAIHNAISNTLRSIQSFNSSPLANQLTESQIHYKIFSDNILIAIEKEDNVEKEKMRILILFALVSEIQRNFIIKYRLFLRGGFTKGTLSINNDYIFGDGLIEAVEMENSAKYPRIVISKSIIDYLFSVQLYTTEEADRAINIEMRSKNGEDISEEDYKFYQKMLSYANYERLIQIISQNKIYISDDTSICLSYLYLLDIRDYMPIGTLQSALEQLKQISQADYEKLGNAFPDVDVLLSSHKQMVEEKLIKYSNYSSFAISDLKKFDVQEKILKKYVWTMVYHNYMCKFYNKMEYYINTIANCERRYMKLVINVI